MHYSCHTPDGEPAPIEGWSRSYGPAGEQTQEGSAITGTSNTCGDTTTLGSLRGETQSSDSYVGWSSAWTYRPPQGVVLQRFAAARLLWQSQGTYCEVNGCSFYDHGANATLRYQIDPHPIRPTTPLHRVESTATGQSSVGTRPVVTPRGLEAPSPNTPLAHESDVPRTGIPWVTFGANCRSSTTGYRCDAPNPYNADVVAAPSVVSFFEVFMMKAYLEDNTPPRVTAVGGLLAANSTHKGVERVTFSASDVGGGVYRAVADAKVNNTGDWTTLSSAIVDRNAGKCVDVGSGSEYEFRHQVPCRAVVADATLDVDTTRLPAGNHALRVYVEDAAGNAGPVIADRPFSVAAPPPAGAVFDRPQGTIAADAVASNGSGASTRAVLRVNRPNRTIDFGRATTVSGLLVDEEDRGISGAAILVQERSYIPKTGLEGPAWRTLGSVTTMVGGTFNARIPAGASRALRLIYRADPRQSGYTTASEARIAVRAGVRIGVTRSVVRNGNAAVFSGRIAGAVPRAGVLLTLQAFQPGRGWTPAQSRPSTARTRGNGRFRMTYRFTRTFRRTTYRFRVLVNEDSRFAYTRAASRVLKVIVRP